MSENFEDSVDKYDLGELRSMDEDRKIFERIAKGAEILGERELRKDLDAAYLAYASAIVNRKWLIGIAASISIIVIGYWSLFSGATSGIHQQFQIDESPIYGDSAVFDTDSIKFIQEKDTLKIKPIK